MEPVARVPLTTRTGVTVGVLELWPRRKVSEPSRAGAQAEKPAEIHEANEYLFTMTGPAAVEVVEPEHLFDLDPAPGADGSTRGRLRTGNHVGAVEVRVAFRDSDVASGWLEIRSTKLDYEDQYRWMLAGIAQEGAELLLRHYAPTSVALAPDLDASPRALYQQLAFLSAILRRPHTVEAIERVLRAPYVSYVDVTAELPIGRGVPGSSSAVRSLSRPGARIDAPVGLTAATLPERVRHGRTQATIDNPPNRFVRFVLDHWAGVLAEAAELLTEDTADHRRGRREVAELRELVERWRSDRRLADVGRLGRSVGGNQVVLRRPGYREVHQAFVESLAAGRLRWEGGDDLHRTGQQDVAQLYEYWCYLELRRIVEGLCDYADAQPLTEVTADGMHLRLRRGVQQVVSGFVTRSGRQLDIELWFNRTFSTAGDESWSMQMRPDCSLKLSAQGGPSGPVVTWVHFDAKYRLDTPSELFVDEDEETTARRADLLKMHAYRDAIRHSAGSYVLFPGNQRRTMAQYREVLPGLGALPLTPGSDGHATATTANDLERFIDELLDHVADQATARERAQWWTTEAHSQGVPSASPVFVPLERPPADTAVLIGYYRSPEHLEWIRRTGLYNLRFGSRHGAVDRTGDEASAELLVLWSREHDVIEAWWLDRKIDLYREADMRALGYPREPEGAYLCRRLAMPLDLPPAIDGDLLAALRKPGGEHGAPVVVTWADLLAGSGS